MNYTHVRDKESPCLVKGEVFDEMCSCIHVW